jgi:hypothetical protein
VERGGGSVPEHASHEDIDAAINKEYDEQRQRMKRNLTLYTTMRPHVFD